MEPRRPPCVSVYLPTHRRRTEARADQILYRNLCRDVERILERDVPGPESREIVDALRSVDREDHWDSGGSDGLAVFAASGFQECYSLSARLPELSVVGASFHTKPLLRFLQANALSYHLLALNAQRVALYDCHGDLVREVVLPGLVQAVQDELALHPSDGQPGDRRDRLHYGRGGAKEHVKMDREKFFRSIAKEVWKGYLRNSIRPLILAMPSHEQPVFRRVAQIPTLLERGISVDPSKLDLEGLAAEARRVLEPEIQSKIARAKEEFGFARSKGLGSDSLQTVASAVIEGRVKLLFVESGRRVWGLLDLSTGEILPGDKSKNAFDVDLLDEVAEQTIVRGGEVYVLGKDDMPTTNGVAAVFRF